MSRSEFFTIVTCAKCSREEQVVLPERYQGRGQSFISDALVDLGWVVDRAKGTDICPSCLPPERDQLAIVVAIEYSRQFAHPDSSYSDMLNATGERIGFLRLEGTHHSTQLHARLPNGDWITAMDLEYTQDNKKLKKPITQAIETLAKRLNLVIDWQAVLSTEKPSITHRINQEPCPYCGISDITGFDIGDTCAACGRTITDYIEEA